MLSLRESNHKGSTLWMAGGGVKGGFSHGETDDHGYEAITGKVDIHDWHAPILLGFDHEKLNFRFGGRNICLTDLYCEVVKEILA